MIPVIAFAFMVATPSGQWTLNNGTRVSCIFVLPSQKQAWRPVGSPVDLHSLPHPNLPLWSGKEEYPVLAVFLNQGKPVYEQPMVRFKLPATSLLEPYVTAPSLGSSHNIWISCCRLGPHQPLQQDIAVGIANGPWNVATTIDFRNTGSGVHAVAQHGERIRLSLSGTTGFHNTDPSHKLQTLVKVPSQAALQNLAVRFSVKTMSGNVMGSAGWIPADAKGTVTFAYVGDVKTVSRIDVQTCPYDWTTIRAAHFKPNP